MMQPLLSILIPTTLDRTKEYNRLIVRLNEIYPDIGKDGIVEEITDHAGKEVPIGEKREGLYRYANGLYSWQIDDDDDIAPNAIELILEAIKQEPDCITFEEFVSIDGKEYKSNHSLKYSGWEGDGSKLLSDGFHFWRTPFFKSVIKTEIARSVPIPHVRWGEDNMYADELHKVLKTEVHIDQQLYLYQYISSNPTERYGLDRS